MGLLLGVALLVLFLVFGKTFAGANPQKLAKLGKSAGGAALLVVAAWLTLTGRWEAGLPLGAIGLGLLGYGSAWETFAARYLGQRPGMARRTTSWIEVAVDPASGRIRGRFLAGPWAGTDLDRLSLADLKTARERLAGDRESVALLEAYLDGRAPRWRENVDDDPARRHRGAPGAGGMSEEEAYQTLGLRPGATEEEIRAAHRSLMKRVHPDLGGSAGLATRLNLAKERLLGRG